MSAMWRRWNKFQHSFDLTDIDFVSFVTKYVDGDLWSFLSQLTMSEREYSYFLENKEEVFLTSNALSADDIKFT